MVLCEIRLDKKEVNNMVKVNGEEVHNKNGISLEEFLISEGYLVERIVVELNGEILSKPQFNQTNIKDGDSLEVISFVGGG